MIFNKLGLVNKNSRSKTHLLESKITEDLQNGIMPDLTGLNIKDALYILETYFQVHVVGSGGIVRQSIKKGENFLKGSVIKLELA